MTLSGGTELSYLTAGDPSNPTILLLHGFPNSARGFRDIIPLLARDAHVIAPDLPGFGESDPLHDVSFAAFAEAVTELLDRLEVGPRFIYLHDFGSPVGLRIAMDSPELVLGLVIQNANAHHTGFGPAWADTMTFWANPTPQNEAAATVHLTAEGIRDQYIAGIPKEVAACISSEMWEEDWRVMNLPGRMSTQRALVADYGKYVEGFDKIDAYLAERRPPALMLWGRLDAYFDIAETLSWMKALPRMEAHIFDGGHLLLETHSEQCAPLMAEFIRRTTAKQATR
jgi:pimeloyl-ACP methyl ester carboxylesterase